ncbi:MAG: hypothetical protein HONBIEJF_02466 [Fimbriimonadaceae bacterium]|nr:hypothetical protein [Fimbriimonadaceae bacterium]
MHGMGLHTICHVEYDVTDLERSRAFYEAMFGWSFRQFTDDMVVFGSGEQHIGGLNRKATVNPGSSPSIWFEVENVAAMLEKASGIGGTVQSAKSEVPHVGWSGVVADPDGNAVGLVQFAK